MKTEKENVRELGKAPKHVLSHRMRRVFRQLFKWQRPYSKLGDLRLPKNVIPPKTGTKSPQAESQKKETFYFYIRTSVENGLKLFIHVSKNDFNHRKGTYKSNLKATNEASAIRRVKGIAYSRVKQEFKLHKDLSNIPLYNEKWD